MSRFEFFETRYPPLGNTFLQVPVPPIRIAQKKSRSCGRSSLSLSCSNGSTAPALASGEVPQHDLVLPSTPQWCRTSCSHSSSAPCACFGTVGQMMFYLMELEDELDENDGDSGITLMIGNLPRNALQDVVLEELERSGYADALSFLYVPVDFEKGRRPTTRGFGFVHMKSRDACENLVAQWHGNWLCGATGNATKALSVSRAHVQGVDENIALWKASRARNIKSCLNRPVVFDEKGCKLSVDDW